MRSYYAIKNYKKGSKLKDNMFIGLRPHIKNSLPINKIKNFYGKKIVKKINKSQVLTLKHFK